jgi:hypothetical protein
MPSEVPVTALPPASPPDRAVRVSPPVTEPAATAPASSLNAAELDQLAGELYERVRFHLRAELRRDRERAGFLTDINH